MKNNTTRLLDNIFTHYKDTDYTIRAVYLPSKKILTFPLSN